MNPDTVSNRTGRPARVRRGLSIAEVMISLAITSMLLTAIAAAFHSSSQIITENDEFFRATQAARVCLNQILTEVRRADIMPAVADNSGPFPIPAVGPDLVPISRPLAAHTSMELIRYYRYNPVAKRIELYFQDKDGNVTPGTPGGTPFEVPGYPVASNVQNLPQNPPFAAEIGVDKYNVKYVKRVTVSLDIGVGNNFIRLSGSATPRRNIKYDDE
jgi:type II secretory pathway pseudopilin PulG